MAITFKPGKQRVHEPEALKPEGRSAILYGPPFSGKTSTLQYDKSIRVLLLDFDKNSGVIASEENVDILGLDSMEDYLTVKEGIKNGKGKIGGVDVVFDYDLYVVDSFTRFEELIKRYVATVYAPNRKREIADKFGAQTDWQDLQDREVEEVREWQTMTRSPKNPVNILWIGHDMESKDSSDFAKKIQLRLQGKYAAPGIMSAVDAVFYMAKIPNPDKASTVRNVYGVYTIDLTVGNVTYKADMRVPARERMQLPDFIKYPKWGEVYGLIGATNLKSSKLVK